MSVVLASAPLSISVGHVGNVLQRGLWRVCVAEAVWREPEASALDLSFLICQRGLWSSPAGGWMVRIDKTLCTISSVQCLAHSQCS